MAGVQTRRAGMMLRRAAWAAVAGWSARNHAVAAASIRGVQSSLLIAIATRRYGRHKGGLPFAPTTRLPGASIASPPLRNDAADNRWPGYLERSFECPRVMGPGHRPGVGRYPDSERTQEVAGRFRRVPVSQKGWRRLSGGSGGGPCLGRFVSYASRSPIGRQRQA